ncbi:MAG: hypothetical protein ABIY52_01810, partial [Gemmatimonadaceae bacterium]
MQRLVRYTPRVVALATSLMLLSACREKAPAASDSTLAKDLAMAQRDVAPSVFNDAPLGGASRAAPAVGAPVEKPEPPRARAPTPRPSPRREALPAPVTRSPRPAVQQPVLQDPTPAPAPAQAPAPAAGVIGAGTRLGMSTNAKVCTANLLVG